MRSRRQGSWKRTVGAVSRGGKARVGGRCRVDGMLRTIQVSFETASSFHVSLSLSQSPNSPPHYVSPSVPSESQFCRSVCPIPLCTREAPGCEIRPYLLCWTC